MNKFKLLAAILGTLSVTACVGDEEFDEPIGAPDVAVASPTGAPTGPLMSVCDEVWYWSACADDDNCDSCCAARALGCYGWDQKTARTLHTEACQTQYCVNVEPPQLDKPK